jgi:hypothetical protein
VLEGVTDLGLVLLAHPRQHQIDVSRLQRLAREGHHGPIHAVAVAESEHKQARRHPFAREGGIGERRQCYRKKGEQMASVHEHGLNGELD